MAGTGIRSARWALESNLISQKLSRNSKKIHIFANDADTEGNALLRENLNQVINKNISVKVSNEKAEKLLYKFFLEEKFINLIDIDCFGCPNYLLQPAFKTLSFGGILVLSSTDSRSTTGHDREAALRHFGASSRVHPSSWELALRLQICAIARHSWLLGRGIKPLASFSDGRTFRLIIQYEKRIKKGVENNIGFISRCSNCGNQLLTSMKRLNHLTKCNCNDEERKELINGPLWLGELQDTEFLKELINIAERQEIPISKQSNKLIRKLISDPGFPACCWSIAELAQRLSLKSQPKTHLFAKALREEGFIGITSSIMPGQIRSNAPLQEILKICSKKDW